MTEARDILFMETLGVTICRVEVRHGAAEKNGPTGPGCAASLGLWSDILEHMRVSARFYEDIKAMLGDDDHVTACERTIGATHPCTCGADALRAIIANVLAPSMTQAEAHSAQERSSEDV